jgi:ribosome-associated protein
LLLYKSKNLFIKRTTKLLSNKNLALQTDPQVSDERLNKLIVDAIQDIKGKDIAIFDLRNLPSASNDYFIICHGNSKTQLLGIINNIEKRVFVELGLDPNHSEGKQGTNWMLTDYFSVIVHVFMQERREFYNMEDLWSDAVITKFSNLD